MVCLATCGCARKYWRKQADDLTYNIIRDKQNDPRWATDRVRVETDPRSRLYEAYDPDFEPLPPDDLAAHEFMHWAYGKRGWKHWHEFGDQETIENPHWLEPWGMSQEVVESNTGRPAQLPVVKLTMEDAIDISYIHSRDYQTQIENLYLSALALTAQRFAFDVQFAGINGARPGASVTATDVPGVSDTVNVAPSAGVSQLLPGGAQYIVQLANNTLWLLSSGGTQSSASTLSYSLVQPLLANGGRRFVMANLTQAERNVLYAARDLARYRQGFFTATVAGGNTAGIATGILGVFSGVGPIPTPVPIFSSTGGNGGFLSILQNYQVIANNEYNIGQLTDQLERLRAQAAERPDQIGEDLAALPAGLVFPPVLAGRIAYDEDDHQLTLRGQLNDVEIRMLLELSNDLDYRRAVVGLADRSSMLTTNLNIVQLETQLATQVNGLRVARVNYLNALDQYKQQLGLPVDMPLDIDLSMLKPFEIVDQRLIRLQDRLNAFVPEPPPIRAYHPDAAAMSRVAELMQGLRAPEPDVETLRGLVDEMLVIKNDLQRDGVDVTKDDFKRAAEHRLRTPVFQQDYPIHTKRDPKRDERLMETLLAEFRESEAILLNLQSTLAKPQVDATEKSKSLQILADLREDLLKISQSFSVIQIDLRVDLIDLNPWDMSMEDAVATGLANRLDLMNSRAAVMDARRNVEVAANQLQAVLNVVASGNINTKPLTAGINNPFDFHGDQSNFNLGLQFSTPIQLVNQRNTYRAALIGYQQARRNYMRTEDQVKIDIRGRIRLLDQTRRNFETLRDQVRAATAQLDITSEQTAAPAGAAPAGGVAVGGGAGGGAGGGGAGGAAGGAGAAQGLQIINAINSVLGAQNNLIAFWVQFEAYRLDIYNFMGTLEIDKEGYWTDEFYQARARVHRANPNRLYPPIEYSGPEGLPTVDPNPEQQSIDGDDADYVKKGKAPDVAKPAATKVAVKQNTGHIRLAAAEEPASKKAILKVKPSTPTQGRDRKKEGPPTIKGQSSPLAPAVGQVSNLP
jgi:outer membrane protein TolC